MKNLLLTYALDSQNRLISIDNANRDDEYFCPDCKSKLLLRISKKLPGARHYKRPHYAHEKGRNANCTNESILHKLFKEKAAQFIHNKMLTKESIKMEWQCKHCEETHTGNLLKKAVSVKTEHHLESCVPDIALFDANNKVFAVIEIVVTHKPEPKVKEYYRQSKITLIEIHLTSFESIDDIAKELSKPTQVNLCTVHPRCNKCGKFKHPMDLWIVDDKCYRCKKDMKIAITKDGYGPDTFSEMELDAAKQHGVHIKMQYSRTMQESYLANTCPHCNAFVGNFHLHDYYYRGDDCSKKITTEYKCSCEDPELLYLEMENDEDYLEEE